MTKLWSYTMRSLVKEYRVPSEVKATADAVKIDKIYNNKVFSTCWFDGANNFNNNGVVDMGP